MEASTFLVARLRPAVRRSAAKHALRCARRARSGSACQLQLREVARGMTAYRSGADQFDRLERASVGNKLGGSHVPPLLGATIQLGMCGFTIGAAAYYRQFRVVAVQQIFRDPPPTATLQAWREEPRRASSVGSSASMSVQK